MKPKTLRALYLAIALLAGLASIPAYGQAKPWLDVLIGRRLTHSGSPITQRSNLELGSGFTVADDPANDRTVLTAPGGGGGAGALVVSTQTALRSLHAVDLTDGQQVTVKATNKIWIWSSTSGAGFAGDDLTSAQLSETLTANTGRFYPQDGIAVLPTIAALRAATGSKQTAVQVQAYATLGDGGGDAFDDVAGTISASDDGGNFIVSGAHVWRRRGVPFADIRKFGAKGDTVDLTGLAIASGANTITAGHTCVAADVGRRVTITDAGADDAFGFHRPLQATVNSCSGSNTVISATAARTVSGKTGMLFTDDRAAIKQAYTYLASLGGGTLHVPPGVFSVGKSLQIPANISIVGDGYGSTLRMIDGGWDMNLDPDTGLVADGKGFGLLNLYNVDKVRISNLRVVGSVDTPVRADYTYAPFGVYLASCTDAKIDHSHFENFHYSAIFGSRIASDTNAALMRHMVVESNYFTNTGYPTAKEAVQLENVIEAPGRDHQIIGNSFRHVGAPINMAGDHCQIDHNDINDWIGTAIATGDSFTVEGSSVRNNSMHTVFNAGNIFNSTIVPANQGISVQPPSGNNLPVAVSDNFIHIEIDNATMLANRPMVGIFTFVADTLITGNVVQFQIQTTITSPNAMVGIQELGVSPNRSRWIANEVRWYTSNASTWSGAALGSFNLGPQAAGVFDLYTAHNRSVGVGTGAGVYAFNYVGNHGSGFELKLQVEGDIYDSGIATLGAAGTTAPNRPIYLANDSRLASGGIDSPMSLGVLPTSADTSGDSLAFRKSGTGDLVTGAIRDSHVSGAAAIAGSKIIPTFGAQNLTAANADLAGYVHATDTLYSSLGGGGNADVWIRGWTAASSYVALYAGVTPGNGNYVFAGNGSSELNVNSGSSLTGQIALRVGGDSVLQIKRGSGGTRGTITTYAGSPESNLDMPADTLAFDTTNHDLYIKTTASGTLTGWKLITRSP